MVTDNKFSTKFSTQYGYTVTDQLEYEVQTT